MNHRNHFRNPTKLIIYSDEEYEIIQHIGKRIKPALPPIKSQTKSKTNQVNCNPEDNDNKDTCPVKARFAPTLDIKLLKQIQFP